MFAHGGTAKAGETVGMLFCSRHLAAFLVVVATLEFQTIEQFLTHKTLETFDQGDD